jgi:ATP-binding cassette subfamily C (CFTR/MRP) protein 1
MAELEKSSGKVRIDSATCARGFAYVDQECWIKAGTIKENILFGAPMNEPFYRQVIEACALTSDLNLFPGGDATFVGENGISLSGQRCVIAITNG